MAAAFTAAVFMGAGAAAGVGAAVGIAAGVGVRSGLGDRGGDRARRRGHCGEFCSAGLCRRSWLLGSAARLDRRGTLFWAAAREYLLLKVYSLLAADPPAG
jgi:hypothetical protein